MVVIQIKMESFLISGVQGTTSLSQRFILLNRISHFFLFNK